MPSSADGFSRFPSSPDDNCGWREKPDKKRALEVRLVREVQVLNLKSLFGGCLKNHPTHSFRERVHEGKQHAAPVGRNRAEIRRIALAGTAATS